MQTGASKLGLCMGRKGR